VNFLGDKVYIVNPNFVFEINQKEIRTYSLKQRSEEPFAALLEND